MQILDKIDNEVFHEEVVFSRPNIYIRVPDSAFLISGTLQISSRQTNAFIYWFPNDQSMILEVTSAPPNENDAIDPNSPKIIKHERDSLLSNQNFRQNSIFIPLKNGIYLIIQEECSIFECHLKNEITFDSGFQFKYKMNITANHVIVNYITGSHEFIEFIDFSNNEFSKEFMRKIKGLTLVKRTLKNPETYECQKASSIGKTPKTLLETISITNLLSKIENLSLDQKVIYEPFQEFTFFDIEQFHDCIPLKNETNVVKTITNLEWKNYFNENGVLKSIDKMKNDIYKFGTSDEIRLEAYKFILGYYPLHLTFAERAAYDIKKKEEFEELIAAWKRIKAGEEIKTPEIKSHNELIMKDVERCDRDNSFYSGAENPNLSILHDILIAHVLYNPALGYVQGMTDFLSPLLYCFKDINDTFWCFAYLMKIKTPYFNLEQAYLINIATIVPYLIKFLHPKFYMQLAKSGCGNLWFTITWLKIDFKRCFAYFDILRIWEASWVCPHSYFYAFFTATILLNRSDYILQNNVVGIDEIALCYKEQKNFSCAEVLEKTDALIESIKKLENLPDCLNTILT